MITFTREEAQQVLDALKHLCLHSRAIAGYDGEKVQPPIDMLKAKLKQPENSFSPDWDAMAVMVEEQRRMAKRIEELEQRKWRGLTYADLYFWGGELGLGELGKGVLRAVDAHLREKNAND